MRFRLGTNVAVFLLFFGISLLDALRSHDWLRAVLWLAIGLVFLRADALKRPPRAVVTNRADRIRLAKAHSS
jgi:hypothetical protein